jgi:hypothetical protein
MWHNFHYFEQHTILKISGEKG